MEDLVKLCGFGCSIILVECLINSLLANIMESPEHDNDKNLTHVWTSAHSIRLLRENFKKNISFRRLDSCTQ